MRVPTYNKGYSLLELIIYLALFAALTILIIHSLVNVMKTSATAQGYRRLQQGGEIIMERIVRETREASSIGTSSVYGTHPGTLVLQRLTEDGGTEEVSFNVVNGVLHIASNGETTPLSTGEVSVSRFIVRHIVTGAKEGVKVELTLTTTSGYMVSGSFYSTVVVRGI